MTADFETQYSPEEEPQENIGIASYDKKLNLKYDDKLLMEAQREGSIIISLNEIPEEREEETMRFLDNKLVEYTKRFLTRLEQFAEEPSLETAIHMMSTSYKRAALKILLERGELNTWAFSNSVDELDGSMMPKAFENAMGVIHDYIKTGGQHVKQG